MRSMFSHSAISWFKFKAGPFEKSSCPLECFMSAAVTIYWFLLQHHGKVKHECQRHHFFYPCFLKGFNPSSCWFVGQTTAQSCPFYMNEMPHDPASIWNHRTLFDLITHHPFKSFLLLYPTLLCCWPRWATLRQSGWDWWSHWFRLTRCSIPNPIWLRNICPR